jgi:hypothetical protein
MPLSVFSMGFYSVTHPEKSLFLTEVLIFVMQSFASEPENKKLESIYKNCGRNKALKGNFGLFFVPGRRCRMGTLSPGYNPSK